MGRHKRQVPQMRWALEDEQTSREFQEDPRNIGATLEAQRQDSCQIWDLTGKILIFSKTVMSESRYKWHFPRRLKVLQGFENIVKELSKRLRKRVPIVATPILYNVAEY